MLAQKLFHHDLFRSSPSHRSPIWEPSSISALSLSLETVQHFALKLAFNFCSHLIPATQSISISLSSRRSCAKLTLLFKLRYMGFFTFPLPCTLQPRDVPAYSLFSPYTLSVLSIPLTTSSFHSLFFNPPCFFPPLLYMELSPPRL